MDEDREMTKAELAKFLADVAKATVEAEARWRVESDARSKAWIARNNRKQATNR